MSQPEETESTGDTASGQLRVELALRGILPGDSTYIALRGAPTSIGRSDACRVCIERPKVSRKHVTIYRQGQVVAVQDEGSTNGTYLNGTRVQHAAVHAGALIRIGDWLGLFEHSRVGDSSSRSVGEIVPGVFGGHQLAELVTRISRAAKTELPVVLVGPTGSGKERLARAFHASTDRNGPFHAVNCAALPDDLAEAELFGYQKGAFTGAERNHLGHLRAAHRGTLFLDELPDLSARVQAKLLRALELREVTAVGETRSTTIDIRLVAACQRPLEKLIAEGTLREDLAARIAGVVIAIPPLAERRSDIPSLFDVFLRQNSGRSSVPVSTRLYERLCLYQWPGNVRELEMLARQLTLLRSGTEPLRCSELPARFATRHAGFEAVMPASPVESRRDYERHALLQALTATQGNLTRAARMAGISRQRAYRLMAGEATPQFAQRKSGVVR